MASALRPWSPSPTYSETNDTDLAKRAVESFDLQTLRELPCNEAFACEDLIADMLDDYKKMAERIQTGYVRNEEPDWHQYDIVKKSTYPAFKIQILSREWEETENKILHLRASIKKKTLKGILKEALKESEWDKQEIQALKDCSEDDFLLTLADQILDHRTFDLFKLLPDKTIEAISKTVSNRIETLEEMQYYATKTLYRQAVDEHTKKQFPEELLDLMINYV